MIILWMYLCVLRWVLVMRPAETAFCAVIVWCWCMCFTTTWKISGTNQTVKVSYLQQGWWPLKCVLSVTHRTIWISIFSIFVTGNFRNQNHINMSKYDYSCCHWTGVHIFSINMVPKYQLEHLFYDRSIHHVALYAEFIFLGLRATKYPENL